MPLFKSNRATASAVARPGRYAIAIATALFVVFCIIGISQHHFVAAILSGGCVGAVVGALNYVIFRPGGWGQRWYEKNRKQN